MNVNEPTSNAKKKVSEADKQWEAIMGGSPTSYVNADNAWDAIMKKSPGLGVANSQPVTPIQTKPDLGPVVAKSGVLNPLNPSAGNMPMLEIGRTVSTPVTAIEVDNLFEKRMDEYNQKIRELEDKQQKQALSPYTASQIQDEKSSLVVPNRDSIVRELNAQKGLQDIAANRTNEEAWTRYMANTLSPDEFRQYQLSPSTANMYKSAASGIVDQEIAINAAQSRLGESNPVLGMVKEVIRAIDREGAISMYGTAAALPIGNNEEYLSKAQSLSAGESAARTAVGREWGFVGGFIYDLLKIVPDMVGTMAIAWASGGTSLPEQVFQDLSSPAAQKTILSQVGRELMLKPESVPMTTKIFGSSYASNKMDGMSDARAFTVALLNAYGQGKLEEGGISDFNKGLAKRMLEEGGEEVTQNWWEELSTATVGHDRDKKLFALASDTDSIVNVGRDVYSFALGATAASVGAVTDAPGYIAEKTTPQVTLPSVAQHAQEVTAYQENKEAAEGNKRYKESAKTPKSVPGAYKTAEYTKGELSNGLLHSLSEVKAIEREKLADIMDDPKSTREQYEQAYDSFLSMSDDTVKAQLKAGTLSEESMDVIKEQAYAEKVKLPSPERTNAPTQMESALTEAGVEVTEPVEPADYESDVDVSRMSPIILSRMYRDIQGAPVDAIMSEAETGATAKEIAAKLEIPLRQVKSTLTLRGVPKAGTEAFNVWQAGRSITNMKDVSPEEIRQAIMDRADVLPRAEAEARAAQVPTLVRSQAKVITQPNSGQRGIISFGKQLGVDVVFYSGGPKDIRGIFTEANTNTVFINSDRAKSGAAAMDILGHEFFHTIASNNPDVSNQLKQSLKESLTDDQIQKVYDKLSFDPEYRNTLMNDRDLLVEEILADEAGSLFTDKSFWDDIEPSLAKKLARLVREFIQNILDKIQTGGINTDVLTESQIKKFRDQFEAAVKDISAGVAENADGAIRVSMGTVQPKFSIRSFQNTDLADLKANIMAAGFEEEAADKYIADMTSIAAIVLDNPALQFDPNEDYSAVKKNSDPLYGVSIDFSTLCKKRVKMQATLDAIYAANGRMLAKEDILRVRSMLSDLGEEVACGLCYVDSARLKRSAFTNELVENWEEGMGRKFGMRTEEYKDARDAIKRNRKMSELSSDEVAEIEALKDSASDFVSEDMWKRIRAINPNLLLTTQGNEIMMAQDKEIYDMANVYINEKTHSKALEPRTEYKPGDLMNSGLLTEKMIDALNRNAGLRWQSWSDFELVHLLDAMQVIGDMSMMGLKGHMYTKVPEAAMVMGNTGMMINLSLIPKGSGLKNGRLVFDTVEGMPFETAMLLRNQFSDTAGTIAIGVNDAHIMALMKDSRIDYIIPYHASGLNQKGKEEVGIGDWVDYTSVQNEKKNGKGTHAGPEFMDWWSYDSTGNENTLRYLNAIAEMGMEPKFISFLLKDPSKFGSDLTLDDVNDGAWKLLVDRKMFNNSGDPIVQLPVKPSFDTAVITNLLENYTEKVVEPNQVVVDAFTSPATKFSRRVRETHGVSQEMADLAGAALADIDVIAKGISTELLNEGAVSLVGRNAADAHELAAVAQIVRDPRFETMRYVFTDDQGTVISDRAITSRLPGVAKAFPDPEGSSYIARVFNDAARKGAKSYYLMHNHPSGNPSPSPEDISLTKSISNFAAMGPIEFGGHVVINSGRYEVIDGNGDHEQFDLQKQEVDKLLTASRPHVALGRRISGPESVAEIAKMVQLAPSQTMIIASTSRLDVRGIVTVPDSFAKPLNRNTYSFNKFMYETAVEFGSGQMFLVTERDASDGSFDYLIERGYVTDVLYGRPLTGRREAGVTPTPGQEFGDSVYGMEVKFSVRPTTDDWTTGATFNQVQSKFPDLFGTVEATEEDKAHGTQITTTVGTYKKIGQFLKTSGFSGRILDASSGKGLGAKALKDMGFDVVDLEPYPGDRTPDYTNYDDVPGQFDLVISNAVLNVLPQDLRDDNITRLGDFLKPGGQMIVNVRGSDVLNSKNKEAINADNWEFYIPGSKSYQKGFTRKELMAYMSDALPGFDVSSAGKMISGVAAIAKRPTTEMYSVRVYHGTPHDFDQFSLENIGTGEGAQAFGWGLYFAGNKSTAEWYRDKLSRPDPKVWANVEGIDTKIRLDAFLATTGDFAYLSFTDYTKNYMSSSSDPEQILEEVKAWMATSLSMSKKDMEELNELTEGRELTDEEFEEWTDLYQAIGEYKEAIDVLDTVTNLEIRGGKAGRLYHVDVDIDPDVNVLDWDANMSNQGRVLQEFYRDNDLEDLMQEQYRVGSERDKEFWRRNDAGDESAWPYLREMNEKEKTYRAKIYLYNAIENDIRGSSVYRELTKIFESDRKASLFLNDLGVRAIQYYDGMSRRRQEGFKNTVIFDENIISVVEKYSKQPTINVNMTGTEEVKDPILRRIWTDLERGYTRVVDRFYPTAKISEKAKILSANAALVSGTVEHISKAALTGMDGQVIGESLYDVVQDVIDDQDFWQYMAQRHNIDRYREGSPVDPGMTSEDSAQYVSEVEADHPEWKKTGDSIVQWIDQFMTEWGVNSGVIDRTTYMDWREMYPSYFPTQREFSDLEDRGDFGPGKRFVDLASPIKRATGSERDLSNPVGNIINMVNKVVRTARYNEVGLALLESARAGSDLLEVVPAGEAMFNPADNLVSVWDGGRMMFMRVNNIELLDSIKGLPKIINNAPRMRKVTGVYKSLITQDNPLFAIRNILRDVPTAYVYGSQHNPLMFGVNLAKAAVQAATGTGGAAQYMAMGGAGSGQFHADEAAQYAKLLQPSAASKLGAPIRAIKKLNEIMELAPRISEFNHVLDKTGDIHKALYAAQTVTVDFARGGDMTKMAEPFVPYLNASVQGIDKFVQSFNFIKDPKGALLRMVKAGVAVTAPQIASYMLSMLTQPDEYEDLSQRTKDSYYVFPKGDGTFYKIPKSREISVVFGTLLERSLVGNFEGFAGTVATNFSPVDPFTNNIFSPIVFNIPANKDFAGRPIVPLSLGGFSPGQQYDANTSEIGKFIGERVDVSPKVIDYIVRSYSGVIGQFLLPATTLRSGSGNALERMTIGAFEADPAFSSEIVTQFYNIKEAAENAKNDKNRIENIPSEVVTDEERYYNQLAAISSQVSAATQYINTLKSNDPEVRNVKLKVNELLKRANATKDPYELSVVAYELESYLYGK